MKDSEFLQNKGINAAVLDSSTYRESTQRDGEVLKRSYYLRDFNQFREERIEKYEK